MNADPEVMRYFPAPMTESESVASFARIRKGLGERGWGIWAVECDGELAGFTGLAIPQFAPMFKSHTEVLWRLRREFWGRGVAEAAADHALAYGFGQLGLAEIVAFTATINSRSIRLMERLGFTHDPRDDFDHPSIPEGHPLRRHVLYRSNLFLG